MMARIGSSLRKRFILATTQISKAIAGTAKSSTIRRAMLLVALLFCATAADAQNKEPVNVILDTDMASDVDDVGALVTLLALEDLGEAKILAVGVSVQNDWAPLCVDAIIKPHPSYDQCAVHYAVRGFDGGPAEDHYDLVGPGRYRIDDSEDDSRHGYVGYTGFDLDPDGLHKHKRQADDAFDRNLIAAEMYELMKHNPYGRDREDPTTPPAVP